MREWPQHWYDWTSGRQLTGQDFLARSHQVKPECYLWDPGTYRDGPAVPLLGGSVSLDATASVRASCQLEVPPFAADGTVLVPAESLDALAPFGSHLKVYYTYVHQGWYQFRVPLGVFRLGESGVEDDGAAGITATGYDLSRSVSRNKLVDPWVIPAGVEYGDAIFAMVQGRAPHARRHPSYPEWPLPARDPVPTTTVLAPETDVWAEAEKMATAVGCEAYFDGDGFFRLRELADPSSTPPVWRYAEGENAVLLGVSKRLSDDPGYNGVVMTAEATTLAAPVRAVVWDEDPESPTYAYGAYGMVPDFQTNPYVTNQAMATNAARAALLKLMGASEQLSLAVVPNAAHEPGDVVTVERAASRVSGPALVDKITVPLRPGEPMNLVLRARKVLK